MTLLTAIDIPQFSETILGSDEVDVFLDRGVLQYSQTPTFIKMILKYYMIFEENSLTFPAKIIFTMVSLTLFWTKADLNSVISPGVLMVLST